MNEAAGSLRQKERLPQGDGDLCDFAESLRPEYLILKSRFRCWQSELQEISLPSSLGTTAMTSFQEPQQIAETLYNEFLRFDRNEALAAEPEVLRRLLRHGLTATSHLRIRCAALTEAEGIAQRTADICQGLLRDSSPIPGGVSELVDHLRSTSGFHRTWVLYEPEIDRIVHASGRSSPRHCRHSWQNLLEVAVLSARIAIRVCETLSLTRPEIESVITASLLQDCGFLLLERQHRCSPQQLAENNPAAYRTHPRFSAALAAGVLQIPSGSLAAIAEHHTDAGNSGAVPRRRVACIVAEISRFVDAFRSQPTVQRQSYHVALDVLRACTVRGYQHRVMQTLISVIERGLRIERSASDETPVSVSNEIPAQDSGGVTAPHFSRPSLQPVHGPAVRRVS